MKLEFIVREVKEDTKLEKDVLRKYGGENQFIVTGEVDMSGFGDCYLVQHIGNDEGLKLIPGVDIQNQSYACLKSDLEEVTGCLEIAELDIPKEYLTLDIVEDILRLNRNDD